MQSENPRLHTGPILSVAVDGHGALAIRRDTYQRLSVQIKDRSLVDPPVMQLSVTGVLIAPDASGLPTVLLGKRSDQTRIYQSMWELAPSGGIDPPVNLTNFGMPQILEQLQRECSEELGFQPDVHNHTLLGLVTDPIAMSTDVVIRLDLPKQHPLDGFDWEYTDVRWVSCNDVHAFTSSHHTIPPTLAILRAVFQPDSGC
ncbi:MAG TPA: NUDIX hydrolase [Phycisphaerales bacterium]|nr:NUDIX hydrolase [Phycisphaerales bacterium]